MSRLSLLALVPLIGVFLGSTPKEQPTYVYDTERVLQAVEHRRLDSLYRAHHQVTGNEIVLVTTSSFGGQEPVHFAVDFGNSLGIGDAERDNGLVIAYSKTERKIFLATGYGTEQVLHDSICKRIIDQDMIPRFKEDKAFDGLWAGSLRVVEFLERPENRIP